MRLKKILLALVVMISLSSCAPTKNLSGNSSLTYSYITTNEQDYKGCSTDLLRQVMVQNKVHNCLTKGLDCPKIPR